MPRRVYRCGEGSRPYYVHVPPGASGPLPLLVVLHGCAQDAAGIAAGSGLNALADAAGFAVAYPEQTSAGNRHGCWNWFDPAHQRPGGGEPALIAVITGEVVRGCARCSGDPERVVGTGMSAVPAWESLSAVFHRRL